MTLRTSPLKVSHSRLERYKQCSESYRLYSEERLSGIGISSPLFFGSAIDAALELFLLKKKQDLTERELTLQLTEDAYSMFDKTMKEQDGQLLERNPLCEYYASDFDSSILKEEDLQLLQKQNPSIFDFFAFWEETNKQIQLKKQLSLPVKTLFNHLCWLSLYRKGELLLKAYETDILPKIHRVYAIQKEVQLKNAAGDELNGKIDFIASFTDDPETQWICDHKTSSKPYAEESVSNSPQLHIYCEAESIPRGCFVVLEKSIRKKDPKVRTQIIKDEMYEDLKELTFSNIDATLEKIARREFHKHDSPKKCFFFGKKCPYYEVCWQNDFSNVKKR